MWFALLILHFGTAEASADGCLAAFRDPMDQRVEAVVKACWGLQDSDPSECQRKTFERCQKNYNAALNARTEICAGFKNDATFLSSRQYGEGVGTGASAEEASATLEGEYSAVSAELAGKMQAQALALNGQIKQNFTTLSSAECVKSVSFATYGGFLRDASQELAGARTLLLAWGKKKKAEAASSANLAKKSRTNGDKMSTITKAGDPASRATATATTTQTSPSTAETPAPFSGDSAKFLEENGIKVDSSFTDAQRHQIAEAVNLYPACQRPFLKGTSIINNPSLSWKSPAKNGKCLPGQNVNMNPPTIALNPTCNDGDISEYLVVHELMHALANRRGYYLRYREAYTKNANCPVSPYSGGDPYFGRNLNEDFAEAGRIALDPSSELKNDGSCVDARVQAVKAIVQSCK